MFYDVLKLLLTTVDFKVSRKSWNDNAYIKRSFDINDNSIKIMVYNKYSELYYASPDDLVADDWFIVK